jgi:hypothetical protein
MISMILSIIINRIGHVSNAYHSEHGANILYHFDFFLYFVLLSISNDVICARYVFVG